MLHMVDPTESHTVMVAFHRTPGMLQRVAAEWAGGSDGGGWCGAGAGRGLSGGAAGGAAAGAGADRGLRRAAIPAGLGRSSPGASSPPPPPFPAPQRIEWAA